MRDIAREQVKPPRISKLETAGIRRNKRRMALIEVEPHEYGEHVYAVPHTHAFRELTCARARTKALCMAVQTGDYRFYLMPGLLWLSWTHHSRGCVSALLPPSHRLMLLHRGYRAFARFHPGFHRTGKSARSTWVIIALSRRYSSRNTHGASVSRIDRIERLEIQRDKCRVTPCALR